VTDYPCPLRDPADPGRPPAPIAVDLPAGGPGRRLAIVDTHFPWRLSGFRFHEFTEIRRRRPDTVIFSLHTMSEEYEAPIFPLADFPVLAPALGITDVYAVFLNLVVDLLGLGGRFPVPGMRGDLSIAPTLERHGMRFHAQLYPGGGLLPTTDRAVLDAVVARCSSTFTNVAEAEVEGVDFIPGAVVDTDLYRYSERREEAELQLLFAATDSPRKGLRTLIEAFNRLPPGFHLHIAGPNEHHAPSLTNTNHTFHGWLGVEALRDLCTTCDVIVAPLTAERCDVDGVIEGLDGMIDGFPTTVASNAMVAGCCLVASNPRHDHSVFTAGDDYVEFDERDVDGLVAALLDLRADRTRLRALAARGARTARERLSVAAGVDRKLRIMGLDGASRPVDDVRTLHAAGLHLLEAGDPRHASRLLATAVRVATGDDLLNDAAVAALACGELDLATSLLDAALFADPGNPSATENLLELRGGADPFPSEAWPPADLVAR
jgi:glycosyltransferase involved in cell wall biosynthesis